MNSNHEFLNRCYFGNKLNSMNELMLSNYVKLEEAYLLHGEKDDSLSVGLFDELNNSLKKNDLSVAVGRKESGLTSLALTIAVQNCLHDNATIEETGYLSVLFFSANLSAENISMRMLSSQSGVPIDQLCSGQFDSEAWRLLAKASHALSSSSIEIISDPTLTLDKIKGVCDQLSKKGVCIGLIIVDDLENTCFMQDADHQEIIIAETMKGLQQLARKFATTIFTLATIEPANDHESTSSELFLLSKALFSNADATFFLSKGENNSALLLTDSLGDLSDKKPLFFREDILKFEHPLDI